MPAISQSPVLTVTRHAKRPESPRKSLQTIALAILMACASPAFADARLANISARGQVLTGDDVMIGGIVIGGTNSKTVVIRAIGPSLANFGVTGVLANPTLQLFSGATLIDENDNWQDHENASNVPTLLAPADALEATIVTTLEPGPYTAIVRGVDGATGISLVEIYEIDTIGPLVNISTRARVGTGDNVLIAGLIIEGDERKTVVIRGMGTGLADFGVPDVLLDPELQIFAGQELLQSNNNWQDHPRAGELPAFLQPTHAAESAIVITLDPGAYTAILRGIGLTSGNGLVEVYEVADDTLDFDQDGLTDDIDPDRDNDTFPDIVDAHPLDDTRAGDADGDGVDSLVDDDDDGDGVADAEDHLPLNPDVSNATTAMIGPAGGAISSPDGLLTLTFPEGALDTNTDISVGQLNAAAMTAVYGDAPDLDNVYVMAPEGLTFPVPVAVQWHIPEGNATPDRARTVFTVNNLVGETVDAEVITDLTTGNVTTTITHFSGLGIGNVPIRIEINRAGGPPIPIVWNFDLDPDILPETFSGRVQTDGYSSEAGFSIQPVVIDGAAVIGNVRHETALLYQTLIENQSGVIFADCLDATTDGLEGAIAFDVYYEDVVLNLAAAALIGVPAAGRGKVRVVGEGLCKLISEGPIEPVFHEMDEGIDRINIAAEPPYTEVACSGQTWVAVATESTTFVTADGQCTERLNFPDSNGGALGAILLQEGELEGLLTHATWGTGVGLPEDGFFSRFFGDIFGPPSATTDAVYGVNADGSLNFAQGLTVNNGVIYDYHLDAEETAFREEVMDTTPVIGTGIISYSPITTDMGVGVVSGDDSEAFLINLADGTAESIGPVGVDALAVRCTPLADNRFGCVATSYGTSQLFPMIGTVDGFEIGTPFENIRTASPTAQTNAAGDFVIAAANDTDTKISLLAIDINSLDLIQGIEWFIPDLTFDALGLQAAIGVGVVLTDNGPEGGMHAAVRGTNTGGVVTWQFDTEAMSPNLVELIPGSATLGFHYYF